MTTRGVEDGMGERSDRELLYDILFYNRRQPDNHPKFDAVMREACIKVNGFDPDAPVASPEQPSMSTGDAEPLREDTITFVYDGMEAVTHACGLLDVIKQEWAEMWTDHDQAVRDGLSRMLSTSLYAKETEQAFDMQNPRLDHIEGKGR